jgi:hypothetical protein
MGTQLQVLLPIVSSSLARRVPERPMFRRDLYLSFGVCLFLLVLPPMASAQTIEIKAQPGVTVLAVTEEGRVPLGTVTPSGELHVPERLLDRDMEFEIVLETVPEGTHVALVERGRTDPICSSPASMRVSCVRTGTFVRWGRLNRINVSDAAQVTVDQDEPGNDGLRWRPGVIVSAEGARAFVSNDDRLCREAGSVVNPGLGFVCDTESSTDAFGASVGVTVARFLALQAAYLDVGRLGFDLRGTADGLPVAVTGGLDRTRGPMFSATLRADVGWPLVPFFEAGAWKWNTNVRADVTANGSTLPLSRSLGGWAPVFGAGVEVWPVRYLGFHAGVKWIRLDEELSDLSGLLDRDERFTLVNFGLRFAIR